MFTVSSRLLGCTEAAEPADAEITVTQLLSRLDVLKCTDPGSDVNQLLHVVLVVCNTHSRRLTPRETRLTSYSNILCRVKWA